MPRLALEIALRAEEQAKAFFERVNAESRNARSHITSIAEALARLPRPFADDEEQGGDPTIEPQR